MDDFFLAELRRTTLKFGGSGAHGHRIKLGRTRRNSQQLFKATQTGDKQWWTKLMLATYRRATVFRRTSALGESRSRRQERRRQRRSDPWSRRDNCQTRLLVESSGSSLLCRRKQAQQQELMLLVHVQIPLDKLTVYLVGDQLRA